jgi:ABC-type multidrug transport system permease subunit
MKKDTALALASLTVSSIMTMAAYLTGNFVLYLTIGSLLITLMNFTSTIYYPLEAFAKLLGWEVVSAIRYNPASLASDIARSIISRETSLESITMLSIESMVSTIACLR